MSIKVYFVNNRIAVATDCGIVGSRIGTRNEEFQITSYDYGSLRWGTRDILLEERFRPQRTAVFTIKNLSYVLKVANFSNVTGTLPSNQKLSPLPICLFALNNNEQVVQFSSIRVFYLNLYNGGQRIIDFVPVLDADGTPCMFDKISRTCFYNDGSGTFGYRVKITGDESAPFSLRDPYYTAPSGVYARPSGENELEILADTEEPAGDGWEWFANTGEAHEHFGIKQDELLTTAQTNDP